MGLRPYRGTKTKALEENIVLGEGEVFFEFPESGVGTGKGKIKMGDGNTPYGELPYFIYDLDLNDDSAIVDFTDSNTATSKANDPTYLSNINPNANLKRVFTNLKQLLINYNSELNTVRESISTDENKIADLTTRVSTAEEKINNIEQITSGLVYSPASRNSFYRGKHLGNIHSLETVRELLIDENHNFRDVFLGDTVTMDFGVAGSYNTKWAVAGFNIFMGMANGFTNPYYEQSATHLTKNHIVLILKDVISNHTNFICAWENNRSEYYNGTYCYSKIQENVETIGIHINIALGDDCMEHIYCPTSSKVDLDKLSDAATYNSNSQTLWEYNGRSISCRTIYTVGDRNYAMIPTEKEFIGDCVMSSSPLDNLSACPGKFPIYNYISPKELHYSKIISETGEYPNVGIATRSYSYNIATSQTAIDHHIVNIYPKSYHGQLTSGIDDSSDMFVVPYIVIS